LKFDSKYLINYVNKKVKFEKVILNYN